MIEQPRNVRSDRTRRALLAAMREILETDGFEALSMAAIAERAHVTRRSVYLHFASRSAMVQALFDYVAAEEGLEESLSFVWAAPDCERALRAWAQHLSNYHARVLRVDQAVERLRHTDKDAAAHWKRVMRAQRSNTRRLAEWAEREGVLRAGLTVERATDMLWALTNSTIVERLLVERRWPRGEFAARFGDVLVSSLLRRHANAC